MKKIKPSKMVTDKTWEEFRQTGLLLFVNQFLHIFGWAIVLHVDEKGNIENVLPARVKFRGFTEKHTANAYIAVADYLSENIEEIKKETNL